MSEQVYQGYPQTQNPEQKKKPQDINTLFSNIASQAPEEVYGLGTHQKEPYVLHEIPAVGTVAIVYLGNHQFLMGAWLHEDENCWVHKTFEYRFDSAHRANRLFAVENEWLEYAPETIGNLSALAKLESTVMQLHDGFHEARQQAHANVIPMLGAAAQQGGL